jgi:hypothetical protein
LFRELRINDLGAWHRRRAVGWFGGADIDGVLAKMSRPTWADFLITPGIYLSSMCKFCLNLRKLLQSAL